MRVTRRFRRDGLPGVLRSVGSRLGLRPRDPLRAALSRLGEAPRIVQIGAHVGNDFNDPLWGYFQAQKSNPDLGLRAVLVEPIREFFEQLKVNYADVPGVVVEHCAIADSSGVRTMSRLSVDPLEHGMPGWLSQLSSLKERANEANLTATEVAFVRQHQTTESVSCLTLGDLLAKHEFDRIDLLQIDVEGFEYELIRSFDFHKVRPRFINLERIHLGENEWPCWRVLRAAGYCLEDHGIDTFCW